MKKKLISRVAAAVGGDQRGPGLPACPADDDGGLRRVVRGDLADVDPHRGPSPPRSDPSRPRGAGSLMEALRA